MLSRRVLSLRYFAFESIVSARPTRVVTLVNSLLPFLVSLVREGQGVDAVGGAEAIISHVMSQVCMCKCMCVCWRTISKHYCKGVNRYVRVTSCVLPPFWSSIVLCIDHTIFLSIPQPTPPHVR